MRNMQEKPLKRRIKSNCHYRIGQFYTDKDRWRAHFICRHTDGRHRNALHHFLDTLDLLGVLP